MVSGFSYEGIGGYGGGGLDPRNQSGWILQALTGDSVTGMTRSQNRSEAAKMAAVGATSWQYGSRGNRAGSPAGSKPPGDMRRQKDQRIISLAAPGRDGGRLEDKAAHAQSSQRKGKTPGCFGADPCPDPGTWKGKWTEKGRMHGQNHFLWGQSLKDVSKCGPTGKQPGISDCKSERKVSQSGRKNEA